MNVRTIYSLTVAAMLVAPPPAAAQTSGANAAALPAWTAFKKTNDTIKDYTETVTTHEVQGGKTEDRVYHFSYQKPTYARSAIVSGPGHGGEAVWHGGDQVKGHQGGFLSGIKLVISIHDGRATDLRGKTIDAAFYPSIIAAMDGNGGKMTEEPGPTVDGAATDSVVLIPSDPSKVRGLTKDVIVISRTTHLPVEHMGYQGAQLVEDEKFTDVKLNPGLPESTFEM